MNKIKNFINNVYETGNLKNISLSDFKEIEYIYNSLIVNKKHETLLSTPAEFFKKYGYKVSQKNISYVIER